MICETYLGHDNDLFARQVELLDRLAEDDLRETIGVDLYFDRSKSHSRLHCQRFTHVCRIERGDAMLVAIVYPYQQMSYQDVREARTRI